MNPVTYAVYIVDTLITTDDTQFKNMWENKTKVFFTDSKSLAEKSAEKLAGLNPNKMIHIARNTAIISSSPGPVTSLVVNDKGEILPK